MAVSKLLGAWGEATAAGYLRKKHYKILASGYHSRFGEIDLIARDEESLQQTESLLHRAYNGSVSLLVSALTKKQTLPQDEINELYAILKEMEEKNNA